jgi:excisionase family DNA binding protein
MTTYSTMQAAKLLGIGNDTLHRWIHEGKIEAPKIQLVGGVKVRLWTDVDVERVKEYKVNSFWGKGSRRKRKNRKNRKN